MKIKHKDVVSKMTDNNSGYGGYVTDAGRNLLMKLQTGDTMRISRVMVGDGRIPNGVNPRNADGFGKPALHSFVNVACGEGRYVIYDSRI